MGKFWRAQCFFNRPYTSLMGGGSKPALLYIKKHTALTSIQPQLCPRAEATCPRITDLLTHICSGDFMLHLYGFFGLLGTLANTELSSIQCQDLGCGLWDECDRNRNQMPLLAWRDSQLSEGDRCTHTNEAKAGRRGLSNPPRCLGDDVKPVHATQLSSWNDIAAAAFMAAGIGLAPAC